AGLGEAFGIQQGAEEILQVEGRGGSTYRRRVARRVGDFDERAIGANSAAGDSDPVDDDGVRAGGDVDRNLHPQLLAGLNGFLERADDGRPDFTGSEVFPIVDAEKCYFST